MSGSIRIWCFAAIVCCAFSPLHGADVDFSGLPLAANSYWNGSDKTGGFATGGLFFNNEYTYYSNWGIESWAGWSYSNVTSTAAGYSNQYASITGGGISGAGSNYGVAYVDSANGSYIDLGNLLVNSLKVTNTAYAFHSMKDGDAFAKKFGPGDWFKLSIRGFTGPGATGSTTGRVDFLLADGANILNHWTSISLTSLAAGTRSLGFELTSSDTGSFGMNTPAYFAIGSLTVVPEPGSLIVTISAVVTLAISWRRRVEPA